MQAVSFRGPSPEKVRGSCWMGVTGQGAAGRPESRQAGRGNWTCWAWDLLKKPCQHHPCRDVARPRVPARHTFTSCPQFLSTTSCPGGLPMVPRLGICTGSSPKPAGSQTRPLSETGPERSQLLKNMGPSPTREFPGQVTTPPRQAAEKRWTLGPFLSFQTSSVQALTPRACAR